MKFIAALVSLMSISAYAEFSARHIPYNLCADKTKTDCKSHYMPVLGQIDNSVGHQIYTCGDNCIDESSLKSAGAIMLLIKKTGDFNFSHYVTYEFNPENLVYVKLDQGTNLYERVIVTNENDTIALKYCSFSSNDLISTLEKFKSKHNSQAGVSLVNSNSYNDLKTAFKAQEDTSWCSDLSL